MSEFERLLQERAQIEQWLDKLTASGDKTPANVRERVQADYQKRLDEVQKELNGHRDEITDALERHRSVREELLKQQASAEERRAEAELRYTVGEYDDEKWNGIREEVDGSLNKIGEELSGVDAEISSLEQALASIEQSPESATPTADVVEPATAPEGKPQDEPATSGDPLPPPLRESQPEMIAVTSEPEPAQEPSPSADDSLEFLDVGLEPDEAETPETQSGAAVPMPPDAAELLGQADDSTSKDAEPALGTDDVTSFSKNAEQPKKGAAKTLKCGECGAMNLPTEWYCERCGAELAAL